MDVVVAGSKEDLSLAACSVGVVRVDITRSGQLGNPYPEGGTDAVREASVRVFAAWMYAKRTLAYQLMASQGGLRCAVPEINPVWPLGRRKGGAVWAALHALGRRALEGRVVRLECTAECEEAAGRGGGCHGFVIADELRRMFGEASGSVRVRVCVGRLGRAGLAVPLPGYSDVRVDRHTVFGNPFPLSGEGGRSAVCAAHRELLSSLPYGDVGVVARRHGVSRVAVGVLPEWSVGELDGELEVLAGRLRGGESLRLLCWCHPLECHAQALAVELKRRVGGGVVCVV